ncbi:MAG: 16S rRNA (cytosine(967)-C(5))-methyltransferase [Jaaginema sp. PMC 1079.18]|nr:16S rRNA (cytosine(967)-C(5))-methyltransferase [Jaaginema sp. PMC 1080.18]MEC4851372.1 16S rRNA (cytosine(967)-C(5))-methyltransferase [Jaaginema sp. PMC 1079.18]MEC4868826.1 16S rRNA (cytosine(967)-C(5))-methyltransferase [Jaaginema sp. PMC 1078.18]
MTEKAPRQLALLALQDIQQKGAYTDIALDRVLRSSHLEPRDRALVTELVYGIVRRQRSLDALIDQLAKKKARQQPPVLRGILWLGLYQLRYLDQIPAAAAVHTSVELAQNNRLGKLKGVVNGILRQYIRLAEKQSDPLLLTQNPVSRVGTLHSFPDWMVQTWVDNYGVEETAQLCDWFNQPPHLDLRVNPLKCSVEDVERALHAQNIPATRIPFCPQGLRLEVGSGAIQGLPGFAEGWWTVQDASAQLVTHLLDPQPGEKIWDVCAAPGGKTTHIAELMGDRGWVLASDRDRKRLRKISQNAQRLQLQSIHTEAGDSRSLAVGLVDRVLVDAPCSGLGTLHRHPDIRWRQNPTKIAELVQLQRELLTQSAQKVKANGILIYSTCTLNAAENEEVVKFLLKQQPDWQICAASEGASSIPGLTAAGWYNILPHRHDMDGFFMVKLQRCPVGESGCIVGE